MGKEAWLQKGVARVFLSTILAVLLADLSYAGLVVLSAPPAPGYLVVVHYHDRSDLPRLASLGLDVLDLQADRLAALAAEPQLAALARHGFEVEVLDASGSSDAPYFLVTTPPGGRAAAIARHGQVFPYVEGAFLLKTGPGGAESLAAAGFSLQKLWGGVVLPGSAGDLGAERAQAQDHDPLVQGLVEAVSQTELYTTILHLQDDDGLPGWDARGSRYYRSAKLPQERDYIYQRMQALGLDVRYHTFTLDGHPQANIEGTLGGWGPGEDVVLIVSAHYDSTSGDPLNVAPGADDNASGTAAVLEAARLLSRYRFQHSLRFVAFAGEELGLWGSRYYASDAYVQGTDIAGVINLDMVGWDSDGDRVMEIHAGTRANSQALGEAFLQAGSAYGVAWAPEVMYSGATFRSDHASFWSYDYPAILAIEDFQDYNPHYHTITDTLEYLDLSYAAGFVGATVAAVAELAGMLPPGVRVTQAGPPRLAPGAAVTFTVDYGAPGPDSALGIVVTHTLSPGLTYLKDSSGLAATSPASGTLVWQAGDLSAYARRSFVVTAAVTADAGVGTLVSSTLTITGATSQDAPEDNRSEWTGMVSSKWYFPMIYTGGAG
jgi:uncharacterized repeat protein (TIGR01451 family)